MENYSVYTIPLLLAVIGALIALGKGLITEPALKARVLVGLSILGAATSALAGGVLHFVPNLSLPSIISLGCALGIMGYVFVENSLKKYSLRFLDKKEKDHDSER